MRHWRRFVLVPVAAAVLCAAFADTPPNQEAKAPPKGDSVKGKAVFEENCSECHYPDATDSLVGPGLKGVKDGKLPSGRAATREAILSTLEEGVDEMPPFREKLKASEKEDVIAYVLTL